MRLILSVLILTIILATPAFAQEAAKPATVEITLDGKTWEAGRPLAVCVQTGLRASDATGAYRLEYRFRHRAYEEIGSRSTLPELRFEWAKTSFMLVDTEGNLIATATGQIRGKDEEQVQVRANNGDGLFPGDGEFTRICGELVDKKLIFVPRDPAK